MTEENKSKTKKDNDETNLQQKPQFLKSIGSNIGNIFSKGGNTIKDKKPEGKSTTESSNAQSSTVSTSVKAPVVSVAVPQTVSSSAQISEKKGFTVHLSIEDDKENIYQVNDDNDDDEEDEDEEEEEDENTEEKHQEKPNKPETPQEKQVVDIQQQEQVNKKKEIELTIDAKALIFKEKNIIKSDKHLKNKERNLDRNLVCHYLYRKGEYIDISTVQIHNFLKIKSNQNKGIFSKITFGKKKDDQQPNQIEKKYMAMFNENYIYFIKDIEIDKKSPSIRKIGNKKNLQSLTDVSIDEINSVIKLSFTNDDNSGQLSKKTIIKFKVKGELIAFAQMVQYNYKFDIKGIEINKN